MQLKIINAQYLRLARQKLQKNKTYSYLHKSEWVYHWIVQNYNKNPSEDLVIPILTTFLPKSLQFSSFRAELRRKKLNFLLNQLEIFELTVLL